MKYKEIVTPAGTIVKTILGEEPIMVEPIVNLERKGRMEEFKTSARNSVPLNITNVMIGRFLADLHDELKDKGVL